MRALVGQVNVSREREPMTETAFIGEHERRVAPRTMVSVPLRMVSDDGRPLLTARTVDLSTRGALLHGGCSLHVGQSVRVEISRGTARNPLCLTAEIVRISEPNAHRRQHGIAVRFTDVGEIDATILASIIAAARR
jgi:hypothetical protein